MKVAVLHAETSIDASRDEQDGLIEVASVIDALERVGHEPKAVSLSLDLTEAVCCLRELEPDVVFNLVESLHGRGQFVYFAPAVLDYLKIPYTGAQTNAMYVTTNKLLTKQWLKSAGIPTPKWQSAHDLRMKAIAFQPPYIIKPLWEDASVGLDEHSLVYEESLLLKSLQERTRRFGECFVESYVHGREINISLLAAKSKTEVLPPAEIVFQDYPKGKPRIVGYQAKWQPESFEYQRTVRSFEFSDKDSELIAEMCEIALQCWRLFELRGYARVDFRVDKKGIPWVLEVNSNPGISPDSGFVAAAEKAGLTFEQVVERIIQDCDFDTAKGELKFVPDTPHLRRHFAYKQRSDYSSTKHTQDTDSRSF